MNRPGGRPPAIDPCSVRLQVWVSSGTYAALLERIGPSGSLSAYIRDLLVGELSPLHPELCCPDVLPVFVAE